MTLATVMNAILGGWQVSGIFQARSGFPITVTDGRDRSLQGTRGNERPNCIGDPTPSNQNSGPLARHQCIRDRAAGHVRQLRRSASRRAPGYKNMDLTLAKRFGAGRPAVLSKFRAEAFNLTNTPSFSPPARDISNVNTFGTITGTVSTARTVELVLKFFF